MRISIIIPVYNAASYLKECIDSILFQQFEGYEIILVNDGSTDDSLSICNEYASLHSNIIVLTGKNEGVSAARNKALDIANGQWLVFVDADDILLPDALSVLYNRSIITGADLILANAMKIVNGEYSKPFLNLQNETLPNAICHIKHFALWCYLIPAKIVKQYHIRFVEGLAYSEDRVFIYQLARFCETISCTEIPVYAYRINPTSACQSRNGMRKGVNHFIAASHLYKIADSYKRENRLIFNKLTKEANHVIDLGIYQFLQIQPNCSEIRKIWDEYTHLYGLNFCTTSLFCFYMIKDYLTIQRRKFITLK